MENQLRPIPFEQLMAYLFGELPETLLQETDELIINDPYYYDLVQQLMQYCEAHQIYNRSQLEGAIQQEKSALFEKINQRPQSQKQTRKIPKTKTSVNTPRRKIIFALLILILGSIGAYLWTSKNKPLPKPPQKRGPMAANPATEKLLTDFWQQEKEAIGGAGDDIDWEESFRLKELPRALQELETSILESPREQAQLYYFAGILHLYLQEGDRKKALDYLRRGAVYRNDVEYDYSKHLIIALAENGQFEAAFDTLRRFPQYRSFIPQHLLEQITASNK